MQTTIREPLIREKRAMETKSTLPRRWVICRCRCCQLVASPAILDQRSRRRPPASIKIGMPLALTGPLGSGRPAAEARRGALCQAAERQGRHPRTQDRAADRGHRRQSRHLRAQGPGDGRALRLPSLHRHYAVLRGARHRAQARGVELDLHLIRQRRWTPHGGELCSEFLPRQYLRAHGRARGVALSSRRQSSRASMRLGMDYAWGHNSVQVFENEMKRLNIDFVGKVFAPTGTKDYSTYITKIRQSGPTASIWFWPATTTTLSWRRRRSTSSPPRWPW